MSASVLIYLVLMIAIGLTASVLPILRLWRRPYGELIWGSAWTVALMSFFFILMAVGWLGDAEEFQAVTCTDGESVSLASWFANPDACGGDLAKFTYCERFRTPRLCQPLNTFSDLGFIAAGFWILSLIQDGRLRNASGVLPNPMSGRTIPSWTYAAIVIFMGPGSMFLHASFHQAEGFLDALSVVVWAAFGFAYTFWRLLYQKGVRASGWEVLAFWVLWGVLIAGFILTYAVADPESKALTYYEVAAGALFLVVEIVFLCWCRGARNARLTIMSLMTVTLAIVLWFPSGAVAHDFCVADCADQGHALFHIMAAVATLSAFGSFQSERVT